MQSQKEKPVLLKILLILTFIGSGMTLFSNFSLYVFFEPIKALVNSKEFQNNLFGISQEQIKIFFEVNPFMYFLQGILSGFSLAGAILIWNLKKIGFHFYTIAQILLLIIPKLFIPSLPFPGTELLISFLFVFYYSRFLSLMK